jgi:hypothetical protein
MMETVGPIGCRDWLLLFGFAEGGFDGASDIFVSALYEWDRGRVVWRLDHDVAKVVCGSVFGCAKDLCFVFGISVGDKLSEWRIEFLFGEGMDDVRWLFCREVVPRIVGLGDWFGACWVFIPDMGGEVVVVDGDWHVRVIVSKWFGQAV